MTQIISILVKCTSQSKPQTQFTAVIKMSLSRVGHFIKNVFTNITVEPIVFLYILTFSTYSIVFQNLQIEKACKINLNQTADICDNLNELGNEQIQNEVLHELIINFIDMRWDFKCPIKNLHHYLHKISINATFIQLCTMAS